MKKRSFLLLVTALSFFIFSSYSVRTLAETNNYDADQAFRIEYGWSEEIPQGVLEVADLFSLANTKAYDTWELQSTDV